MSLSSQSSPWPDWPSRGGVPPLSIRALERRADARASSRGESASAAQCLGCLFAPRSGGVPPLSIRALERRLRAALDRTIHARPRRWFRWDLPGLAERKKPACLERSSPRKRADVSITVRAPVRAPRGMLSPSTDGLRNGNAPVRRKSQVLCGFRLLMQVHQ